MSSVLGHMWSVISHVVAVLAVAAALLIATADPDTVDEVARSGWFLPLTLLLVAALYWAHALKASRAGSVPSLTALLLLLLLGAAFVSLVYALGLGRQWYAPAIVAVGALYAAGSLPRSPAGLANATSHPWRLPSRPPPGSLSVPSTWTSSGTPPPST